MELNLQHVINVSCDFQCDLMIRSDKTHDTAELLNVLQSKRMGKSDVCISSEKDSFNIWNRVKPVFYSHCFERPPAL